MAEGVFGPVGWSTTSDGLAYSSWVVPDRSGDPHVVTVEPARVSPSLRGALLGPLLGSALTHSLLRVPHRHLLVLVDRAVAGRLRRPDGRYVSSASEPIALADGTELRVLAESRDGGNRISCDVYVDGVPVWSRGASAGEHPARPQPSHAEVAKTRWEGTVVLCVLLVAFGFFAALTAIAQTGNPIVWLLAPVGLGAPLLGGAVAFDRVPARAPDSDVARGAAILIAALPIVLSLCYFVATHVSRIQR